MRIVETRGVKERADANQIDETKMRRGREKSRKDQRK